MLESLFQFVAEHPRLVVLTGAGVSLGAGIPTYRDADGVWRRSAPIQHRDFLTRPAARQRYWARSFTGWPAVAGARPTAAHLALAELERAGRIGLLVTQNVDSLHQKAGHQRVVDLHGALKDVVCMGCGTRSPRDALQIRLATLNPHLQHAGDLAPDGDADVPDAQVTAMRTPDCEVCGGLLKPDVVFFGDAVAPQRVAEVMAAVGAADALLVVGTSLMVFSGFRFVRHAHACGVPVACINPGRTRADELFALKILEPCEGPLTALAAAFRAPGQRSG